MGNCNYCISRDKKPEPTPHEMGSFTGSFVTSEAGPKPDLDIELFLTRTRSTAATDTIKSAIQLKPCSNEEFRSTRSELIMRYGEHFRDKYIIREQFHSGHYKEVSKVIHKTTRMQRVALRYLDPLLGRGLIGIMKTLNHPYVMRTYEYFDEKKFFEIADFYQGGELAEYIAENKILNEKTASKLMKQILCAVNYLHHNHIIHRNITPENLVFEDSEKATLRLIGFSSAIFEGQPEKFTTLRGDPHYIAPEAIRANYTLKSDLWSCGVIMFYMLTGTLPFTAETEKGVLEKVLVGKVNMDALDFNGVSSRAKDLIKKLLEDDPAKRISAKEALKHSWIVENSKEPLQQEILKAVTDAAIENVKKFNPKKKVQELFWLLFTDNLILPVHYKHLSEVFISLDTNFDGKLSKEELLKVIPESQIDEVLKNVDLNNSGYIEYSEFIMAAFPRAELITTEKINVAFKLLDKDQDGYIGINDLRETFDPDEAKGIKEEVWTELIIQADKDLDGLLGLHDFCDVMKDMEKKKK